MTAYRGDAEVGQALLREAIAIIDRSDETMFQANARMALAEMLESQGDTASARDTLQEALALYRAKEIVPSITLAEQRLAVLA